MERVSIQESFNRHVEAIRTTGRHSTMYTLSGRIDFRRLSRQFNMMVKRRYPDAEYHFFWFLSGNNVTVCYAGNLFLLDAVDEFMIKAVELGIAGSTNEIITTSDKSLFNGVFDNALLNLTIKPKQRSFGGSHSK